MSTMQSEVVATFQSFGAALPTALVPALQRAGPTQKEFLLLEEGEELAMKSEVSEDLKATRYLFSFEDP